MDTQTLLNDLVKKALAKGADAADALGATAISVSHAQRLGKMEKLERSEAHDLGLRVLVGQRQAMVSSNDWDTASLDTLVDQAIAMAKAVPEDQYVGLADPDQLFTGQPKDLDLYDAQEPDAETLIERARIVEEAALAVDGITNSEGAEADWNQWEVNLVASNGFSGTYRNSRHGVGVSVLAGSGVEMETDYDFKNVIHGSDLGNLDEIGRTAGNKAVAKLGPKKIGTAAMPMIFDPRISNGLARHLTSAINGASIARGTSFLKDKLGQAVMASSITIVEDPHRLRGLGSKPFDAEGLANHAKKLVDAGQLTTWVLDLRTARQLGMESTGNAARGVGSPPSPATTNVHIEAGQLSPEDLMADIKQGFYITSLMGMGVNGVTGDYSRGASGFAIIDGKIAYPVSEVTIAGNLKDMFMEMTAASDLEFKYSCNAPTIRIDGMTLAGM
ncbi:TldD/PmbA family protein [Aestuariispira insulae]|uniref:Microcin-processing peptidase 1 n=1 Tax=Aestuariispira insulae TaxID=1461337 RepID=A0A3D9HWV7_9PROT|nr:TldD/PmbA family protein [Aestuariispira insulae]RED53988.1 microcin-processing peptidase 1 [Aestuariispira insulae]